MFIRNFEVIMIILWGFWMYIYYIPIVAEGSTGFASLYQSISGVGVPSAWQLRIMASPRLTYITSSGVTLKRGGACTSRWNQVPFLCEFGERLRNTTLHSYLCECVSRITIANRPFNYDKVFLPALIRLANVRQVKGGGSVGRIRGHTGDASLVSFTAVSRVALIPDVDWDFLTL